MQRHISGVVGNFLKTRLNGGCSRNKSGLHPERTRILNWQILHGSDITVTIFDQTIPRLPAATLSYTYGH